jgi:signal recognition particle subunit SRP54
MFENLTKKLDLIFQGLRKRGKLSESDVDEAMHEIRLALLEADVHFSLVKEFVAKVRERSIGSEVSKALNPGQQVVKIVNEELIAMLGEPAKLNLSGPKPWIILFVGLQGSGKTTTAAKLAKLLRNQGERVMLVAADPYRPAAIKQLQSLGERIDVPVFSQEGLKPPDLIKRAVDQGQKGSFSVIIADTAGRSQLDTQLMEELGAINKKVKAAEILLVVDAMIGQEALNIANEFRKELPITGLILTKMDGDARGGAAISVRSVTQVPIKYIGTGEGMDGLEAFDPRRLSSRILGMGDMIGLIERAESVYDQKNAEEQTQKLLKGDFSLEDFASQIKQIKKMGSVSQIMDMMPGNLGQAARSMDPKAAERQLKTTEAIISSMTIEEKRDPDVLNASRRRRIARGCGLDVQDVNRLLKQFRDMQRLMKTIKKTGGRGLPKIFG